MNKNIKIAKQLINVAKDILQAENQETENTNLKKQIKSIYEKRQNLKNQYANKTLSALGFTVSKSMTLSEFLTQLESLASK